MSSAGHILDMMNRLKQNRALLRARRDKTRNIRQAYLNVGVHKHDSDKPIHKQLSEEDRQKIRQQIAQEYRKARWEKIFAFILSLLIVICFIYFVNKRL